MSPVFTSLTLVLCSAWLLDCHPLQPQDADENPVLPHLGHDVVHLEALLNNTDFDKSAQFKHKWLSANGDIHDSAGTGRLEVAATLAVSEVAHATGTNYIRRMIANMPSSVFTQLARQGSVGLFTAVDKTTIFPEYAHLRDRPECAGTCAGACSNTCTGDGRKWDSLAGVGGTRATCLDDNFMCTSSDPYFRQYNVLVHEFGHTIHMYGIPASSGYVQRISSAWNNARTNRIWDVTSYAMYDVYEYFAEGTTVWFNTSRHPSSSGGMNGCGRPSGQFCATETEARNWLLSRDPQLHEILSFVYTDHRPSLLGGLTVCPS